MSKTVKVRIAVAVTPSGEWNATGWTSCIEADAMDLACSSVSDGEARYFVEAELPIPEPVTVQGTVVEDRQE